MNIKAFFLASAFSLLATPVLAEEAEITIDIIEEESGGPEQLMNRIELPEAASFEAHENGQPGLDIANDARERGLDQAAESVSEVRDVINLGGEIPLPSDVQENLPQSSPEQPELPTPPSVP